MLPSASFTRLLIAAIALGPLAAAHPGFPSAIFEQRTGRNTSALQVRIPTLQQTCTSSSECPAETPLCDFPWTFQPAPYNNAQRVCIRSPAGNPCQLDGGCGTDFCDSGVCKIRALDDINSMPCQYDVDCECYGRCGTVNDVRADGTSLMGRCLRAALFRCSDNADCQSGICSHGSCSLDPFGVPAACYAVCAANLMQLTWLYKASAELADGTVVISPKVYYMRYCGYGDIGRHHQHVDDVRVHDDDGYLLCHPYLNIRLEHVHSLVGGFHLCDHELDDDCQVDQYVYLDFDVKLYFEQAHEYFHLDEHCHDEQAEQYFDFDFDFDIHVHVHLHNCQDKHNHLDIDIDINQGKQSCDFFIDLYNDKGQQHIYLDIDVDLYDEAYEHLHFDIYYHEAFFHIYLELDGQEQHLDLGFFHLDNHDQSSTSTSAPTSTKATGTATSTSTSTIKGSSSTASTGITSSKSSSTTSKATSSSTTTFTKSTSTSTSTSTSKPATSSTGTSTKSTSTNSRTTSTSTTTSKATSTPTALPLGAPCDANTWCQSSYCRAKLNPDGTRATQAYCEVKKASGAACYQNAGCVSGTCVIARGEINGVCK
ncbi:hypothetical protein OC844_006938 [Tilletia horrida]|nr:hypothetical protein OC844_006938 [Tilletia horrida]